jgi:hypothetical protein
VPSRRGSRHCQAKLTDRKVREMRACRENGWTLKRIARRYDISITTAHDVTSGKTWGHVA